MIKLLAIRRLVRTDINSAGSVSGHPAWEDVIPQHPVDLMQWATALKVILQIRYSVCAYVLREREWAGNASFIKGPAW